MRERLPFRFACVDVEVGTERYLDLLHVVENAREIERATFLRNTDPRTRALLEFHLGYDVTFPITRDWHVRFYASRLRDGRPAYFMTHSAIEYVFHEEAA
jgi:hypothetical protein